jgi:hypothetical protein
MQLPQLEHSGLNSSPSSGSNVTKASSWIRSCIGEDPLLSVGNKNGDDILPGPKVPLRG